MSDSPAGWALMVRAQCAIGLQSVSFSVMTVPALSREQSGRRLTWRELQVLTYLAGHAGRFVSGDELGDAVFGPFRGRGVERVVVCRLRRKLGAAFIEQSHGLGYRLGSQRSAALSRECGRCRRPVVDYGEFWTCYACGATGEGPRPLDVAVDLGVGRSAGPGSRSGAPWTDEEREFVLAHLEDMSLEQLGAALERSESAVRGFLDGLGVKKRYVRAVPR